MINHDQYTRLSITVPVFEETVFGELVEDLGSDNALDFLTTFMSLLRPRITRMEQALTQDGHHSQGEPRRDEFIEALLSLRASSTMVGARRLEALTTAALTKTGAPGIMQRSLVQQLHDEARRFSTATARLQHPSARFAA